MIRHNILFMGEILLLIIPGSVTSQALVLASNGPSSSIYIQGSSLSAGTTVKLKKGDGISILESTGYYTFTGPLAIKIGRIDSTTADKLRSVFRTPPLRESIVGTRKLTLFGGGESQSLWQVDLSPRGGNGSSNVQEHCVVGDQIPTLRRTPGLMATSVVILDETTGRTRALAWPPDQRKLDWPNDLKIVSDATYQLSTDDGAVRSLRFHILSPQQVSLQSLAKKLLVAGCQSQLEALQDELYPEK